MATTSDTLRATTAKHGRHGIGARLAAGAAALGCAAALAFGALHADGGARLLFLEQNARSQDAAPPSRSTTQFETLIYDGTRPGLVMTMSGDTPPPDRGWAIADGTRPGLVP